MEGCEKQCVEEKKKKNNPSQIQKNIQDIIPLKQNSGKIKSDLLC